MAAHRRQLLPVRRVQYHELCSTSSTIKRILPATWRADFFLCSGTHCGHSIGYSVHSHSYLSRCTASCSHVQAPNTGNLPTIQVATDHNAPTVISTPIAGLPKPRGTGKPGEEMMSQPPPINLRGLDGSKHQYNQSHLALTATWDAKYALARQSNKSTVEEPVGAGGSARAAPSRPINFAGSSGPPTAQARRGFPQPNPVSQTTTSTIETALFVTPASTSRAPVPTLSTSPVFSFSPLTNDTTFSIMATHGVPTQATACRPMRPLPAREAQANSAGYLPHYLSTDVQQPCAYTPDSTNRRGYGAAAGLTHGAMPQGWALPAGFYVSENAHAAVYPDGFHMGHQLTSAWVGQNSVQTHGSGTLEDPCTLDDEE